MSGHKLGQNVYASFQEVNRSEPIDLTQFWTSEEMGVAINPCCKTSHPRVKSMSEMDKFEENIIRDSAKKVGNR
jgi:hypothetical protein